MIELWGLSMPSRIECIIRHDLKQHALDLYHSICEASTSSLYLVTSPKCSPSIVMLMLYLHCHGLLFGGFTSDVAMSLLRQHAADCGQIILIAFQNSSVEVKEGGKIFNENKLVEALNLHTLRKGVGNSVNNSVGNANVYQIENTNRKAFDMAALSYRSNASLYT